MRFLILNIVLIFVFCTSRIGAQTVLTHNIPYSTENQNMWGPNGSPFNLDFDWELFHMEWDTSAGFSEMTTIFGDSIGVALDAGTWGVIGSTFSMHGFTTGYVDVDYPVEIHLTFPADYSFDMGEWITVNSDYTVLPGWDLTTHYPSAGVTTWDMDFGFGAHINFISCLPFQDCDTIYIIPPIEIPTDSITIFHLNGQTGYCVYPCIDSAGNFHFCEDTLLPIIIPDWFNIGLTGEITLPYVETTDWINNKCLYASGDSAWIFLNLDIIQFLYAVAGLIPPPQGPAIQQALSYLSGSYQFDVLGATATVEWDLLSADMAITSTNQQDFTFCPKIWCTFSLPEQVEWYVTDPAQGNIMVSSGFSDTIRFVVDNDVHIKYPCFDPNNMDVGIEYDFSNDFTNHTWDSISFDFTLQALWFHFNIPTKTVIEESEMPSFCLPEITPKTGKDDGLIVCSSEFQTPEVFIDGENITKDLDYEFGPLIDMTIPLGYIPFTWYNNTWDLDGFVQDTVFPGTTLYPNYNPFVITDIQGDDILCFGESTGNVSVTVGSGVPPYEFNWSNGEIFISSGGTSEIDSLPLGTYTVTITDNNDCSLDTTFTLVELNPEIILTMSETDVLCNGESTGTASVTAIGGSPGYTYTWSNGENTPVITGIPAGTYYVSVTDIIGCTKIDSVKVNEPTTHVTTNIIPSHVICFEENNGSANLTATGGTPGYTFLWSNGQSTEDIFNLFAGNYYVTITDANGCKTYDSIEITQPELLVAELSGTDISCFGLTDGTIDLTVSGGIPPYTYHWNNAATSEDLSNIPAGTYTVTVIDAHACSTSTTITITSPLAVLAISSTQSNVNCNGGNDGAINLTVTGGTTPYSYSWNNGLSNEDLSNLTSGIYSVTVTDAHSCSQNTTITITQPAEPLSTQITPTDIMCFGGDDGSINLTVSGGTPPYSYLWNDGFIAEDPQGIEAGVFSVTITDYHNCIITATTTVSQPTQLSATIAGTEISCFGGNNGTINLSVYGSVPPYSFIWNNSATSEDLNGIPSGYYSVTITDSHNCKINTNITLSQPQNPISAVLNPSHVSCFGGNDGSIKLNPSGGTPGYTYIWSNGTTTQNNSLLTAGWYYVTIIDSQNCSYIDSIQITQPLNPLSIVGTVTNVECFGQTNGAIDITVSGGTPGYSYTWSNSQMNEDLSSLSAGTYYVTVLDSKFCKTTSSYTVIQPDKIILPSIPDTTICFGQTIVLTAQQAYGGTPPYDYHWFTGSDNQSITVQPETTTSYCVQVTDSNNCYSNTSCVNVNVFSKLNMTITATPNAICEGKSATINANISGGGGPPYTTIFGGDTSNATSFIVFPEMSQTYTITAFDICNFSAIQKDVSVTVLPLPSVNFLADKYSGCVPLEVKFTSLYPSSDYLYTWDFGDSENNYSDEINPVHIYKNPGFYSVDLTVTSQNNCSNSVNVTDMIKVFPSPNAEFMPQPYLTSIVNPDIQFYNNSSSTYFCKWDFGDGAISTETNPTHAYSSAGTYEVTLYIKSEEGCWDTTYYNVTLYDEYVFYAPTAFSPDEDGINEVFRVFGSGIKEEGFHLYVYDRWGELIFESNKITEGWDGHAKNGKGLCKNDSYTWLVTYTDVLNNPHQEAGIVTLIK